MESKLRFREFAEHVKDTQAVNDRARDWTIPAFRTSNPFLLLLCLHSKARFILVRQSDFFREVHLLNLVNLFYKTTEIISWIAQWLEAALTGNSHKPQDVLYSQRGTEKYSGDRKWAEPRIWQPDIWPSGKDQTSTSFWVAQINVFFVSNRKKKSIYIYICIYIYIYIYAHTQHIHTYIWQRTHCP